MRRASELTTGPAVNDQDLISVLSLQSEYHRDSVGTPERGFLSFRTDLPVMRQLNYELAVIVSRDAECGIVGYNIVMTADRAGSLPLYRELVQRYERHSGLKPQQFAVSAQYCVRSDFRGGPVVRSLFDCQRSLLSGRYLRSVGEVDSLNCISLHTARRMLGYGFCFTYEALGSQWHVFDRDE